MGDDRKARNEQNARRVAEWLLEREAEFEDPGINEAVLAQALGLSPEDAGMAVDWLENREEAVRWPQALTSPPVFLLKPGRGWPDLKAKLGERGAHG
jgi:hypothetical protein